MRSWAAVVAFTLSGCIVYRQDDGSSSTWSSSPGTNEPREGQIEVTWQVGPSGCEAAEVETVQVEFAGVVNEFACADERATLSAPVGRHRLAMRGLDLDGVARYAGEADKVRVDGGQINEAPTVLLSALPAHVAATWFFDNGRLCSQNGVEQIEVTLFDDGDSIEFSERLPCEEGAIDLEELEAGVYSLLLLGRADGQVLYSGESQLDVGRGDLLSVEVVLVPE